MLTINNKMGFMNFRSYSYGSSDRSSPNSRRWKFIRRALSRTPHGRTIRREWLLHISALYIASRGPVHPFFSQRLGAEDDSLRGVLELGPTIGRLIRPVQARQNIFCSSNRGVPFLSVGRLRREQPPV